MQLPSNDKPRLLLLDAHVDDRGSFTRLLDNGVHGGSAPMLNVYNINRAYSKHALTLRGLHAQAAPFAETKIVYCVAGAIFDVSVDLRRNSPNFLRSYEFKLSAHDGACISVPPGFLHGYLTLVEETELIYLTDSPYSSRHEISVRWDDPSLAIGWPAAPELISEKDSTAAPYRGDGIDLGVTS